MACRKFFKIHKTVIKDNKWCYQIYRIKVTQFLYTDSKQLEIIGKWDYWNWINYSLFSSVQFSSVTQLCPTPCDSMNHSMPGLPIHHQLPESTQTHVHQVGDAIQPSHPLSSPTPPALNRSQHQGLFQWVNSSHEVAKVLEF